MLRAQFVRSVRNSNYKIHRNTLRETENSSSIPGDDLKTNDFCSRFAAKSSKSHKTPVNSSSSSSSSTGSGSTAPNMTTSSLPVSTQAPVTSSHHNTSASTTPNSQTNVVRYGCGGGVGRLVKSNAFLSLSPIIFQRTTPASARRTYVLPLIIFPCLPILPRSSAKEGR